LKLNLTPRPLVVISMTLFEINSEPNSSAKKAPALVDLEMMYEIENQMNEIKENTLPRRDSVFTLERKINDDLLLKKTKIEITTKHFSLPTQAISSCCSFRQE
jgi:hypothetical protein